MSSGRLANLADCARRVDETIDRLIRWQKGFSDDADLTMLLSELEEVRDEIVDAASDELGECWRALESKVRAMEDDREADDEQIELLRDERESTFDKIIQEAWAT